MVQAPDREAHVQQIYCDAYFTGGGAGYADYLSERDLLCAAGRRYGKLLTRYVPAGRMLDVGAAAGFLLQGFENAGWTGTGVEPNASMARFARDTLGLRVIEGTLENLDIDETFDAVSLIQVIGHFRDPRLALEKAAAKLRPGGCILIECWNRDSWTARLFGRDWHEYSPPSVLHWFSIDGLRRLAESTGLEWLDSGRPTKKVNGGHAKSLLRSKRSKMPLGRTLALFATLVPDGLPLIYPFDDLFWAVFRKSASSLARSRETVDRLATADARERVPNLG